MGRFCVLLLTCASAVGCASSRLPSRVAKRIIIPTSPVSAEVTPSKTDHFHLDNPPEFLAGYERMVVAGLSPYRDAYALILKNEDKDQAMVFFFNEASAQILRMRIDDALPMRPTTHHVLEATIKTLGAQVWRVQVDDLIEGTYLARIVLRTGIDEVELDARPEDALAIAVQAGAPIFISDAVLSLAGKRLSAPETRAQLRP